jgi:hypothetical protein
MLITDLGHEAPTVPLTNDLRTSAAKRITRYAQRMLIENGWPTPSSSFIWMR